VHAADHGPFPRRPVSGPGSVPLRVRPFDDRDEEAVVALWRRCGLVRAWNDPHADIARKRSVQRDLFLVGTRGDAVVATVMAGYDGHRGWINYLAVDPGHRRRGFARELMLRVEHALRALGCPKVNLQVRAGNDAATAWYLGLGYLPDDVASLGKRLLEDGGGTASVPAVRGRPGADGDGERHLVEGAAAATTVVLRVDRPSDEAWRSACERLVAAGFRPVAARDPHADVDTCRTFEDADGYRVVLQHGRWSR
jgi:ribosomal protein S18 acetylase RimI-like enzyme